MRGQQQPRPTSARERPEPPPSGCLDRELGVVATLDRVLEPPRERVDRLGVLADRLERTALAQPVTYGIASPPTSSAADEQTM